MNPPPRIAAILAALLAAIPAVAQLADPPTPAPQAETKDYQVGNPLSWDARWQDRVRFMNQSASHYLNTRPLNPGSSVFLPPVPPPLGSEIPILAPIASGPAAPTELAAYVSDLFYPLLAARLESGSLTTALRARLQAYRASKSQLQEELRARLAALIGADPRTRERDLASFALSQGPRIAELETAAERLRKDLQWSGVLGRLDGAAEWKENPAGIPQGGGEGPRPATNLHLAGLNLRGAAFYQEGLSAAQRRLLLEAAIELGEAPAGAQGDGGMLQFSPEPSRIRIPPSLPEPISEKINEYVLGKSRLKTELFDELRKESDASNGARAQALAQLADAQAARVAAVESMAEEIRRDLATLPNPAAPPDPPALPADIAARISAYRRHKLEVLRKLHDLLAGAPAPSPARAAGDAGAGENANAFAWLRDGKTRTEVLATSLEGSVEEFNARQEELIAGLNTELAAIRRDLSEYVRSRNPPMGGKSIDDLLRDFEEARQEQETWAKYRDYRDAVLAPGLSPAQRRLLFDAAVEQLALPLPAGEAAP